MITMWKAIITGLILGSVHGASVSALADPDINQWNTFHSMGCMLLRECTDGVYKVSSMDDIKEYYPVINYDNVSEEMNVLLTNLEGSGIEVFLAQGKYFPRNHRGVYHTVGNKFFLNMDHMHSPKALLEVTRHEGWHAVQDCMAGTLDNNNIAIVYPEESIPSSYHIRADVAYGDSPAVPWEREAIWAAEQPYETAEALKVCASETRLWEVYTPTPMTREWLEQEGFIGN